MIRPRLNAYQLKTIAVLAMVLDHIGWAFVPTASLQGQLVHAVGRLTAPIMCYFVAEGYFHTRDLKKYILRMAAFALLSAPAFCFYEGGGQLRGFYGMGMIYTQLLGLLAICLNQSERRPAAKTAGITGLCLLSLIGDWPIAGVLWPVFFAQYRGQPKKQFAAFWIVSWGVAGWFLWMTVRIQPGLWWAQSCQFATVLAIPLLLCYDGTLNGRQAAPEGGFQKPAGRGGKWFFYIVYPAHLMLLGLMQRRLGGLL